MTFEVFKGIFGIVVGMIALFFAYVAGDETRQDPMSGAITAGALSAFAFMSSIGLFLS